MAVVIVKRRGCRPAFENNQAEERSSFNQAKVLTHNVNSESGRWKRLTPVTAKKRMSPDTNTVERYSGPLCDLPERFTRTKVEVR